MKNTVWILAAFLLPSCVSVSLPTQTGEKAKEVVYKIPESPFSEIKVSNADKAWISSKSGNTISFLSDCKNPADPTLQQIESEILSVLTNLEILFTQNISYNSRQALETLAQGLVDGVPVKMKLLTFKKNNCSYSLVFGGIKEKFENEISYFNTFVTGFKAP